MDDVLLNKSAIIERYLYRIKDEYIGHEDDFERNFARQDAIILNLLRACEAAIDMGIRILKIKKLGIPQSSRDIFVLLETSKIIDIPLSESLQAMVGFRNIAIHDYRKMDLQIVRHIVETKLSDLLTFAEIGIKKAL